MIATRRIRWLLTGLLVLVMAGGVLWVYRWPLIMRYQGSILDKNEALRLELSAYHVGTLGYVYGYPIVDLLKQKHNQTHRIRDDQKVIAPVNAFYVFPDLRPDNDSGLRAPNNDTLYLNAWLELAQEPVVIHTPDTQDRYFTLSLTNLYSDVTHVGRRVNGTGERYYAIVGPNWNGTLPKEVTPVRMATQTVWVLGRIAVFGANDLTEAKRLGEQFWAVPLSRWRPGLEPATDPVEKALPSAPLDTLEFFAMLNRALRENPQPDGEAALMEQFDQAGFGPHVKFDADELSGAVKKGLERALKDGAKLVEAATKRRMPARNGWMSLPNQGNYGNDYITRAGAAKGGYANLPEESVYPATFVDSKGDTLMGSKRYRLHFDPSQLPPNDAFWSLTVYDLVTMQFVDNELGRYSIGDRTPGLHTSGDGSLDIDLQHEVPAAGGSNWLPTPAGAFLLVVRIYQPKPEVLDGRYMLPPLETLE
jgi:hypothetical protein